MRRVDGAGKMMSGFWWAGGRLTREHVECVNQRTAQIAAFRLAAFDQGLQQRFDLPEAFNLPADIGQLARGQFTRILAMRAIIEPPPPAKTPIAEHGG